MASRKPLRRTKSLRSLPIPLPQPREIADHGDAAESSLKIVLLQIGAAAGILELFEGDQPGGLVGAFLDEPNFIGTKERLIE